MTKYILDTNILSEVVRPAPSEALLRWMAEQNDADLYVTALTVAEIRRGVLEKPAGRRRDQLEAWFAGNEGPQSLFAGRILPFDEDAALIWAQLMAEGRIQGKSRSGLDTIIAAIAIAHGGVVVTSNEKDFEGIGILNPLRPSP